MNTSAPQAQSLPNSAKANLAYRVNGQLQAPQAFYRYSCSPQGHVFVEACAGAGKTWMLVSRILRTLLAGFTPQQILAITFTRKAAAEMQERLQAWLKDFSGQDLPALEQELQQRGMTTEEAQQNAPKLQALYLQYLQQGEPVQIKTFHSWFSSLLRAMPLQMLQQLDLPVEYELLEEESELYPQLWPAFYQAVLADETALADFHALTQELGRFRLQEALAQALVKRAEIALADEKGTLENAVPDFQQVFQEMKDCQEPQDYLMRTARGQKMLQDALDVFKGSTSKTAQEAAERLGQGIAEKNWLLISRVLSAKYGRVKQLAEDSRLIAAQEELESVKQAQNQRAAHLYHQRMVRLSRVLFGVYAHVKREHGFVDMADLEKAAHQLLNNSMLSAWWQERLDIRVRHVLIDEFQDTSPTQWHTIKGWLDSYVGAGNAPSIFIVGDPKQSIYRFRRADPAVFAGARAFVQEQLNGVVLSCDHTRRNAPEVIHAVNATMEAAKNNGQFADFRHHTTASDAQGMVLALPEIERLPKSSKKSDAEEPLERDPLSEPLETEDESIKMQECRQAAAWLHKCFAAGLPQSAKSVMVLARQNDYLRHMHDALAELGIASQVKPDKKQLLSDAPEVQDIVALFDVLVSPRHNLSLVQVLKSPLFGASDAQMIELAQAVQGEGTKSASWLYVLHHMQGEPWQSWSQTLNAWQKLVQRQPPHDALSAIYKQGKVLACYAQAAPSSIREAVLQNLCALPAQMLELDGGRNPNAYAWVRAMRRGESDAASANVNPNAIQLLTVHGAKGLEADVVLMLNTNPTKKKADNNLVLMDWPGEAEYPKSIAFIYQSKTAGRGVPASAQALYNKEQQAQEREEYNALYVAMTRAKKALVISSAQPYQGEDANSWRKQVQNAIALQAASAQDDKDDGKDEEPSAAVELSSIALDWIRTQREHRPTETNKTSKAMMQNASAVGGGYCLLDLHDVPQEIVLPETPQETLLQIENPTADMQRNPKATQALLQKDAQLQALANIGSAMHLALEWYKAGEPAASIDTPAIRRSLVAQYDLNEQQLNEALQRAQTIVQGEAAWAWSAEHISWQGNEVDINWQAPSPAQQKAEPNVSSKVAPKVEQLRIDRLVLRKAHGNNPECWWVLDFKSALNPAKQETLVQQMHKYRQALQAIYPQTPIRTAFITREGRLEEVPASLG